MRPSRPLLVIAGAVCFCAPLLSPIDAQQQPAPTPTQQQAPVPPRPSVQVGVPEGRAGGQANQGGRGRQAGPPRPAPRNAQGRVLLSGATPADKGVWLPGVDITLPAAPIDTMNMQPWTRALYADRQLHELEPHTRCKASGVARQFLTPYGVELLELPELQQVFIFDIGGPHTYRTVYMDGRSHPTAGLRAYYGHSIGWWEGDTLVIDTTNFNEGFWLDRRGTPHTEQLHTVERLTRLDATTMRYELTVKDPGAYTAPWQGQFTLRWEAGTELFEYQCQQANYAHELMVGNREAVDRTSPIVP